MPAIQGSTLRFRSSLMVMASRRAGGWGGRPLPTRLPRIRAEPAVKAVHRIGETGNHRIWREASPKSRNILLPGREHRSAKSVSVSRVPTATAPGDSMRVLLTRPRSRPTMGEFRPADSLRSCGGSRGP
jgi:hypothetical protein